MVNYLKGVRCLYNTDTASIVELDTFEGTKQIRLPYTKFVSPKGIRFNYIMGVKSFCKALGIDYRKYFHLIHKDVE